MTERINKTKTKTKTKTNIDHPWTQAEILFDMDTFIAGTLLKRFKIPPARDKQTNKSYRILCLRVFYVSFFFHFILFSFVSVCCVLLFKFFFFIFIFFFAKISRFFNICVIFQDNYGSRKKNRIKNKNKHNSPAADPTWQVHPPVIQYPTSSVSIVTLIFELNLYSGDLNTYSNCDFGSENLGRIWCPLFYTDS